MLIENSTGLLNQFDMVYILILRVDGVFQIRSDDASVFDKFRVRLFLLKWEQLLEKGKECTDETLDERSNHQAPNLCCTLIYTVSHLSLPFLSVSSYSF